MTAVYNIGAPPSYPGGFNQPSPYLKWIEDSTSQAYNVLQNVNPQTYGNGTDMPTIANPLAPAPGFGRSYAQAPTQVAPPPNLVNNFSLPNQVTSVNNMRLGLPNQSPPLAAPVIGGVPNMAFLTGSWNNSVIQAANVSGIYGRVYTPTVFPHVDPVQGLPFVYG